MARAVAISAQSSHSLLGGPFGAVIVKDHVIIAEGNNQVTIANDPTAHAEVVAIRNACQKLGSFQLDGCTIYSSCEPCPMCLAAIYWARINHIYYANDRIQAAAIGFDDQFLYDEMTVPLPARKIPITHHPSHAALQVFHDWQNNPDKVPY
ncbi:MAG: nucleoside deaminase [Pseudomonadota bacterium]